MCERDFSLPDYDSIDRLLATPDFDPIRLVNSLIPDEDAMSKVPETLVSLEGRSKRLDSTIQSAVKSFSVLGDHSEAILDETRQSMQELARRIEQLYTEAVDVKNTVGGLCASIKPLDNAKRALSVSVTTLRRIQMILITLESLDENIKKVDYGECASNILALSSIFQAFDKYLKTPQLEPLYLKFSDAKRLLRGKVVSEIDQKVGRGSMDESNLPLCALVDAFEDDLRVAVIDLFCDHFLRPYETNFSNSKLTETKSRFSWFKTRIEFYNKNYAVAFPQSWKMQEQIALAFCRMTATHFNQILSKEPPSIKSYMAAFDLVVTFESKMSTSFSKTVVEPYDPNAIMPEFSHDPEGIRMKNEWLKRQRAGESTKKLVPAREFIGLIGCAFAPHLDLYIQSEKESLSKQISDTLQQVSQNVDEETHTISSSDMFVVSMRKRIEKCAGFGIPQTLVDLFVILKELLVQFVTGLSGKIPNKIKTQESLQFVCAIANTTSDFVGVSESLANKIKQLVPSEMSGSVIVEDATDGIESQLKRQLEMLIGSIMKQLNTPLAQIGNDSWSSSDPTDKLPPKLVSVGNEKFGVVSAWLCNENMNRIRPIFTQRMVGVMRDSLFKSRTIQESSAYRITNTAKELKALIAQWTLAQSTRAARKIDMDFSQFETELKILSAPESAMVLTYLGIVKNPKKDHFSTLLKMRGFGQQTEAALVHEYDVNLKQQRS